MKYMPPGIVDYDHAEAVNALAQGQVAMITEWSAFYPTLTDPAKSKLSDCLAVAPEPAGPAGRMPALGGFSLAVDAQVAEKQEGGVVALHPVGDSEAMAKPYVEAGGVSGTHRRSTRTRTSRASYPFVDADGRVLAGRRAGLPPALRRLAGNSEVVAEWGTKMMLGEVSIEQGATGDRHPDGRSPEEGRLLRRQEEAAAVSR